MSYFSHDDIAQIGTPPANAPVGVIRLSGPNALTILQKITRGLDEHLNGRPARAMYDCQFLLPLKTLGGQNGPRTVFPCPARVLIMPAPASYTTEDVAELHLPGAVPVLKAALRAIVAAGARLAEPGEFTFRAFRGGRLSLRQAEAVEEVIRADSDAEKRRALARLGDSGQTRVAGWRDRLLDCSARVEAALDFSEEEVDDDVAAGLAAIVRELEEAASGIVAADNDFSRGCPEVALVGLANAGKSSLLNALLGTDDVIVSPVASTTRDSIRREVRWHGGEFILSDNPGFDPDGDGAGALAAGRAFRRLAGHDLAVWVVDASVPAGARLTRFAKGLSGGIVVVLNKTDKPVRLDEQDVKTLADEAGLAVSATVKASAATGEGIEDLKRILAARASAVTVAGPWNRREIWELAAAGECCRAALEELSGPERLELAAEDLRRGARAFARALGEGYAEEMLSRIFSRFCIGK